MMRRILTSTVPSSILAQRSTTIVKHAQRRSLFTQSSSSSSTSKAASLRLIGAMMLIGTGATTLKYNMMDQQQQQQQQQETRDTAGVVFAEEGPKEAIAEAEQIAKSSMTVPEEDTEYRYSELDEEWINSIKNRNLEDLNITIYQYQVCPFSCKARIFLDYYKIPYNIVEVEPMLKKELAFSPEYKKVPIVVVDGRQINDSSVIITYLSKIVESRPQTDDEKQWRRWVDAKLARVLPPNIYRTPKEAREAFEYIAEMNQFSYWQKLFAKQAGSTFMYIISKRLRKRYHITDERQALYDCANDWMINAVGSKQFHGGNRPDLADLAAYGVLTSIEGLESFKDMVQHTDIGPWYERMKQQVGKCNGRRINH